MATSERKKKINRVMPNQNLCNLLHIICYFVKYLYKGVRFDFELLLRNDKLKILVEAFEIDFHSFVTWRFTWKSYLVLFIFMNCKGGLMHKCSWWFVTFIVERFFRIYIFSMHHQMHKPIKRASNCIWSYQIYSDYYIL